MENLSNSLPAGAQILTVAQMKDIIITNSAICTPEDVQQHQAKQEKKKWNFTSILSDQLKD